MMPQHHFDEAALPKNVKNRSSDSIWPELALAALLLLTLDRTAALILFAIALTTIPTRQILMPAINTATESGQKQRFKILHTLSVLITLAHIAATAYVLARFL